jgi:hypothetical protein
LRIGVDDGDAISLMGELGGKQQRCCRLAGTALGIGK